MNLLAGLTTRLNLNSITVGVGCVGCCGCVIIGSDGRGTSPLTLYYYKCSYLLLLFLPGLKRRVASCYLTPELSLFSAKLGVSQKLGLGKNLNITISGLEV